ncbi:MAG: tetratricopeptide repeat protein, partial [Fuerstiella sp.]
ANQTETQQKILKLLSNVVKLRPALATTALQKLDAQLQKWSAARHDTVAEAAYQSFAVDLPPTAQRRTQLALAAMWFNQVLREHAHLMSNGFQVPRALDERIQKTLKQCYQLASDIGVDDPLRASTALLRKRVVDHFLGLEYEDVAAAAIRVKADVANADLDESAELELAALQRRMAERQLAIQLKQHDGKKQIVLTPAFNEAIAGLKQFITDHPTSERVPIAANGVLAIGQRFEQYEAWVIAAGIYEDFERFAAEIDSLKQAGQQESTYPERAAAARATALHTRASLALAKWKSEKSDDTPPPDQLSDEFQAAQAAWHKVIADASYGTLLGLELPLQAPERLEFGRAICQLGKVLPDHARTVLAALDVINASRGKDKDADGDELIALAEFGISSRLGALNLPGANMPQDEHFGDLAKISGGLETASGPAAATATTAVAADQSGGKPLAPVDAAELSAEADGYGGFGGGGYAYQRRFQQKADAQLIAAVRSQLDRQASQVAMLRDNAIQFRITAGRSGGQQAQQKVPVPTQPQHGAAAVLSDAELQRQQQVLDAVYTALQDIRKKYAETSTADQAGAEIFVIVNHWRGIAQWNRAAELARKFLTDNPTDLNLPKIRQEIARDWLAWASLGVRDPQLDREELLTEISRRFDTAREELQAIIVGFPDETAVRHQAQWDIATSFLTQARVITNSSPTLARGQFVRAGMELLRVAELFHDHPKIGTIPDMLWAISTELATRSYHDEAITIWNELQIHYPTHKIADQSALRIAQTWQQLGQPLRAAEAFLELNFARGGSDVKLQDTIYQIAVNLKNEARWIESLHVLQTFVDSFPSHANAGQSLTMIGQIHQANEVWEDAIAAYRRVIDEFPTGTWTTEARWAIAECTINLSLWQEAAGAYADFQQSYPKDKRVAEANRRIEVLKTLDRYQDVIDEEGQRKAFDAQFQVAVIVRTDLANTVKAIIEYHKVEKNWPNSHLADDALFEIGKIYLERGESELARIALLQSAERYPKSPLADDALLLVGTSYVSEADQLAAVDRGKSQAIARDIAQRQAYHVAQDNRRRQSLKNLDQITALKVQGKREEAAKKEAYFAGQALQFDAANTLNVSNWAAQQEEVLSAAQMADRQDKINAALRQAVGSFRRAATISKDMYIIEQVPGRKDVFRVAPQRSAVFHIERAIEGGLGDRVDTQMLLANIYLNARRYDRAYEMYTALGEVVPEEDQALYAFYFAQSALGVRKYDEYLQHLKEALKLDSEAYGSALVDGYLQVADRYNQAGQLDNYIEHLALAVNESPQTTSLHLKLANAYEEARQYEEAVQQWRLVLDLEPEHPQRTKLLNMIRKHG